MLSSLMRSLPQSTRGFEHKLPPRDAIIAHAIFTSNHSGARAQTPPERRYHRSCNLYLKRTAKEINLSLRSTLQLECSLGGYSHRERCRAPDRIHSTRTRGQLQGLVDSSQYKDSRAVTRTRVQFSAQGLEDSSHYKDSW